jgi:phage shock protein A
MSRNKPGDQEPLDAEIVGETATPVPALSQPVALPDPDYSEGGVPSFDSVRDRIEKRYETSVGAQEIAGLGGKEDLASLDKKIADRDKAAKDKLAEIRRAMGRE